jgi:hypothetical protein
MTFVSTYSSGSIRGWQSSTGFPTYTESQVLLPNISNPNVNEFGTSLDLSNDGNYLIVGETEFTGPGYKLGKAYLYNRDIISNNFTLQQEIAPNVYNGNAWYQFGFSSRINYIGTTAAIGAPGYNTPTNASGAVYIFDRTGTTWNEQDLLLSNDANSDAFGLCIAMNYTGDMVAIGAADDEFNTQSGAVYIFDRTGNTWSKTQKLKATPTANGQQFGTFSKTAISISQDANANYIAVGAVGGTGNVVVFNKSGNTYVQQQIISRPAGGGSGFGRTVAINEYGNILLAGCSGEGETTTTGRTFVFNRTGNTWSLNQTIIPTTTSVYDAFGAAVAINSSGNIAFISDTNYLSVGNTSTRQGATFVFELTSAYIENQILIPNGIANSSFFTLSPACDETGSIFAGSAPQVTVSGIAEAGTVWIFTS